MAQYEEDLKEIEEEILDEEGVASIKTSFNVFRRNFKSHVLNVRILFGILISIGIVQTVFVILIFLKLFYPWVFA
jgi:hypothetical protein